ncbi:MAG: hypothetical protein AAFX90_17620 [Pseudomonadota bacterium]
MTFSDETLLAYLEGNLEEAEARQIEQAVEADPELEQRLMALDPFASMVQGVFEAIPVQAPEVVLPELAAQTSVPAGTGLMRLAAVAASVAIIAASATWWAMRPAPLGWAQQAAIYQSLYVPDTIAPLDASTETLDKQFAMAEEQLGRSLNRDALEALPGLELRRAQVLSFKGKPLIQIVFADEQGQPLAFCVIRQGPDAPNKPAKSAVLSGLATVTWAQDGYGYMLLGSNPKTDLSGELDALSQTFTG